MNVNYTQPGQNSSYGIPGGFSGGVNSPMNQQSQSFYQGPSQQQGNSLNNYGAFQGGFSAQNGAIGNALQGVGGGAASAAYGGAGGSQSGTGYSIPGLVNMQLQQNQQARQQNQQNWTGAAANLQQYTQPYTPAVLAGMQTNSLSQLQGQRDNANRQQSGMMAADGQTDAGSQIAAAQANSRNAMGAFNQGNLAMQSQAALGNNQAGYNVGNSIISHLPQYRPDDYSGLMALTNTMQQQQQLNGIQQNAYGRPQTPMASGNWLGGGLNGTQQGQSGINPLQMVASN